MSAANLLLTKPPPLAYFLKLVCTVMNAGQLLSALHMSSHLNACAAVLSMTQK